MLVFSNFLKNIIFQEKTKILMFLKNTKKTIWAAPLPTEILYRDLICFLITLQQVFSRRISTYFRKKLGWIV